MCHICEDRVKNKIVLTCEHTFCGLCVKSRIQNYNNDIECPICHKISNIVMFNDIIHNESTKEIITFFVFYNTINTKGIKYINDCLNGLSGKHEQMFRDIEYLYSSLKKLLFLISMSKEEEIETDKIYKVVIKYQKNEIRCQFDSDIIENIIANYPLTEELAKKMILTLLHSTSSRHQYSQCIFNCVKFLQNKNLISNL